MEPDQPDESYYDTFHGRGQDEQDQHDLLNDLLPSEKHASAQPAPSSPTPEEQEEMASRQRWTVGRNKMLAEPISPASPPKPEQSEP